MQQGIKSGMALFPGDNKEALAFHSEWYTFQCWWLLCGLQKLSVSLLVSSTYSESAAYFKNTFWTVSADTSKEVNWNSPTAGYHVSAYFFA